MEALAQRIFELVEQAGGRMTWVELVEAVGYQDRQRMTQALRYAKEQGTLARRLYPQEDGSIWHGVEIVVDSDGEPVAETE